MKRLFGSQKPKTTSAGNAPSKINLYIPAAKLGTSSEDSTRITEGTVEGTDEIDEGFSIISPGEFRRAGMRDFGINKKANSFYQQCLLLRNRLSRVNGFAPYLERIDEDPELSDLDVVRRLWHTLAQGTSLCYLYDLLDLPPSEKLGLYSFAPSSSPYDTVRAMKMAAAAFVMGIQKLKRKGMWAEDVETFSVTELTDIDKMDMNGFSKVVATTSHLLDKLPEHIWIPESHHSSSTRYKTHDQNRNGNYNKNSDGLKQGTKVDNSVKELIETERKYLQELEAMQNLAHYLITKEILDKDTVQLLFPGFKELLNFQRKLSIELEQQYELPLEQQRWGLCFSSNEAAFAVYETYCASYVTAAELVRVEEPHLMRLAHLIDPKSELPALLLKPVLRICSYPLVLQSLQDHCPKVHKYYNELVEGVASSKRVADRATQAHLQAENAATVKVLSKRVQDWKGHGVRNFGELLLDDVFQVTKSDVDRIYHVFLFEKILILCKEAQMDGPPLKKHASESMQLDLTARKRTTPLLLKGRVFLNNVTTATISRHRGRCLEVWWKGDDNFEYFVIWCRNADQANKWKSTIERLIPEIQLKSKRKPISQMDANRSYPSSLVVPVSTQSHDYANSNPFVQSRANGSHPNKKSDDDDDAAGGYRFREDDFSRPMRDSLDLTRARYSVSIAKDPAGLAISPPVHASSLDSFAVEGDEPLANFIDSFENYNTIAKTNPQNQLEAIDTSSSFDRGSDSLDPPMVPPKVSVKSDPQHIYHAWNEKPYEATTGKISRPAPPLTEFGLELEFPPAELHSIDPFVLNAKAMKKDDPVIAYYCLYYALQIGFGIKHKQEDSRAYMARLLTKLETMKGQLKDYKEINDDEAAALHIEKIALKLFNEADNENKAGGGNYSTANKFEATSCLFEILALFDDKYCSEDIQVDNKINYAKQKANEILIRIADDAYLNATTNANEISESREASGLLSSTEELDLIVQSTDLAQTPSGQSELPSSSSNSILAVDNFPELKKLMKANPPHDLTGQVTIPDFRSPIYGGFAAVHKGLWNGKHVAVKVLKATKNLRRPASWEPSMERRLFREINVWAAISHRNIAEFLGFTTELSDFTAMVSTWCDFGTAKDYLTEHDITMQSRVFLVQDVADGLDYLHRLKIIHGDLKPTNILIDDEHVARLCDFGLVRLDDWQGPAGMTTTSPYTGTERYKAPELFISNDNSRPLATYEGDVWALGCIAVEFIESRIPYGQYNHSYGLTKAIENGEPPALRPIAGSGDVFSQHLWDVLEACWTWFPEDRLKIHDVVEQLGQLSEI